MIIKRKLTLFHIIHRLPEKKIWLEFCNNWNLVLIQTKEEFKNNHKFGIWGGEKYHCKTLFIKTKKSS